MACLLHLLLSRVALGPYPAGTYPEWPWGCWDPCCLINTGKMSCPRQMAAQLLSEGGPGRPTSILGG